MWDRVPNPNVLSLSPVGSREPLVILLLPWLADVARLRLRDDDWVDDLLREGLSAQALPLVEECDSHPENVGQVVLVKLRLRMTGRGRHGVDASLARKVRRLSSLDELLRGVADGKVREHVRDDLAKVAVPAHARFHEHPIKGVDVERIDTRVLHVDNRSVEARESRPLRDLAVERDDEILESIAVRRLPVLLVELDDTFQNLIRLRYGSEW
jgi:hypothetical protein